MKVISLKQITNLKKPVTSNLKMSTQKMVKCNQTTILPGGIRAVSE